MDDLDAFVKDEQAVADFREKIRDWERPWQTWNDNPTETDVRRLVALLADRERQLAEAHRAKTFAEEAELRCAAQLDEVEAQLRAVAALRDELRENEIRTPTGPVVAPGADDVADCIDAILGGDK